jgi:hypothetical protein
MLPPTADRPKLIAILDQLAGAVEELLLGGLTTASDATKQTVHAAMQEAARFKLLRLGSALRVTAEELGRFTKQDPGFSRRRLSFFLNRSWLLARGLSHALQASDESQYDRLNWSPPTTPVESVDVVCLGAVKKVAAGAFVAFDFRLRDIATNQRLTWSAVFPVKPGVDIPPEGFLHLPQKQKFPASVFLEQKTLTIRNAAVTADESAGRITLNEQSTVTLGDQFTDWARFLDWSREPPVERIANHKPGPLDLETELQEEVVLREYQIDPAENGDEPVQAVYRIMAGQLQFHAVASQAAEGKTLRKSLDDLRKAKKDRPPLYGLMHYERCRLVFQPLTAFTQDGPEYLPISKENVNKAALLKAMKFT